MQVNSETDWRNVPKDIVDGWDRWFRRVRREFCPLLLPSAGKPITYVEIGCWAGASSDWVARNILTHPMSIGFGIDPYWPDRARHPVTAIQRRATERLDFLGDRWRWVKLPSIVGLRLMPEWLTKAKPGRDPRIDILYIDGDHSAPGVVQDFAIAWQCLRPGSIVIFDDYVCRRVHPEPHVKQAVDSILDLWAGKIEPIGLRHRYQRAIVVTGT